MSYNILNIEKSLKFDLLSNFMTDQESETKTQEPKQTSETTDQNPKQTSETTGQNNLSLLDQWTNCMRQTEWNFQVIPEKHVIVLKVSSSNVSHIMNISILEKIGIVIGHLIYERKCPIRYRKNMIEYITRLNFELAIGGFIMDTSDGKIRFRHTANFENNNLQPVL